MRSRMGLMPGPDIPPYLLPMEGRKVSVLIFKPSRVFATVSASAPPFSAALAMDSISPALGESLAHMGLSVAGRAGNVHFDDVNLRDVDVSRHRLKILRRLRGDIGNERRRESLVIRNLVLKKIFDAFARQANGVDHAVFKFGHARRRIADAEFTRDCL